MNSPAELQKWQANHAGFLLIFLTAGNLIAIGGYEMPGVWGQRPERGPGAAPLAGSEGQRPWRGQGAEPLAGSRGSAPGSYTFFTK